jgi:aryl-alcohol dehydrogenase-like predicted oxidoreductase
MIDSFSSFCQLWDKILLAIDMRFPNQYDHEEGSAQDMEVILIAISSATSNCQRGRLMDKKELSRRDFLRNSSFAGISAVAGNFAADRVAADGHSDAAKILNYNSRMHYRRLGKTALMLSEVGIGGHWKAPWREHAHGWWWGKFIDDEKPVVPKEVARNRTDVVSACIDAGVNHLDITGLAEAMGFGAALKGRRDKMIVAADDYKVCMRHSQYCNVKSQIENVESCLKALGSDYIDIWRPQAEMDGSNTDADIEVMIETFERVKKAGKARHLGVSSHTSSWLQHVIEDYPQFEMVIFPCTAKTKSKNKPPVGDNVEILNSRKNGYIDVSLFDVAEKHDVGVITIKPFFGGSLFQSHNKVKSGPRGVGDKLENDLARLTLQSILSKDAVTAVIPGMSTVYEAENAVLASYTRPLPITAADKAWMETQTEHRWTRLPDEYKWLRNWEFV